MMDQSDVLYQSDVSLQHLGVALCFINKNIYREHNVVVLYVREDQRTWLLHDRETNEPMYHGKKKMKSRSRGDRCP